MPESHVLMSSKFLLSESSCAEERGFLHILTKIELQKIPECTINYHKCLLNHSDFALWSLGLKV